MSDMKQQKYYTFLQQQILLLIGLSLIPGLVYVVFGWIFDILIPSLLWYISLIGLSLYGWWIYREFQTKKMAEEVLRKWYRHFKIFMYLIFSSWSIIFLLNIQQEVYSLHYIAIFTQLGASVVASTLLVSDKRVFVPILLTLMLPLSLYFLFIGTWFGYVLAVFSLIFVSVLLYAAYNTNKLIEENYYQAHHDVLTGLYNRRYFMEYMEPLSTRLLDSNKLSYIILIDLDHFKTINDSLGHDVGDKLLIEVANRIEEYSKKTYTLARLGGDEFILISKDLEKNLQNEENAYHFANGLLELISKQYNIDHHYLHISASIGVHELTDFTLDNKNFIKEVDIAMYEAKSQGRDGVVFFNKDLSKKVIRHALIEQKLYRILDTYKLEVYYQPQFDENKNLKGCEALVRWFDDELGVLSPSEFIPIAESTGLILDLGIYVIRNTFKTLHEWRNEKNTLEHFSINVSLRQLLSEPFIREVEILYSYYFSKFEKKPFIVFEITEHAFSHNLQKVVATMKRLNTLGISFSIDDFGTGYSSLQYLQDLPIEEIKIDRSFISGVLKRNASENMVITILSIAENFSFRTVAEGIENDEQFNRLKSYGCHIFQGYYFDKALPKSVFEKKYLFV